MTSIRNQRVTRHTAGATRTMSRWEQSPHFSHYIILLSFNPRPDTEVEKSLALASLGSPVQPSLGRVNTLALPALIFRASSLPQNQVVKTNLGELVGDLWLVAAAAFGLLQADHHQVLKEVLPADVAQLPGGVILHRGQGLHAVAVFASCVCKCKKRKKQ